MLSKNSFEKSKDAVIDACDLILKLWFFIHLDKSQSIPVQKIEYLQKLYLGFTLDSTSMSVSLTDLKQQKIKTLMVEILQKPWIYLKLLCQPLSLDACFLFTRT